MSNIQFDYSTLSTSMSRSELNSVIAVARDTVDSNYEFSDEGSENSSRSNEVFVQQSLPDKYNLVYLTFALLGIGTLLPWNFFITANDYWMYKFRYTTNDSCPTHHNKTDLQASFTGYLAIANNVPYVIFLIICTVANKHVKQSSSVIGSLFAMLIVFSIVTAFVEIDTDKWQTNFYILTTCMIVALGTISAVLQTGVASVVSLLPAKYMHVMVMGQALAGILAAVTQTLSLLGHCNSVKSGLIYFLFADIVILSTLTAYFVAQKTDFFIYHSQTSKEVESLKDSSEQEVIYNASIALVFKQIWPYAFVILLDFWLTLSIYPGLAVLHVPQTYAGMWTGKLYLPLACFLLFNVGDFGGRFVGGSSPIPHSRRFFLVLLSIARLAFFPLFMLMNLHPRHHLPVLLSSDIYYIFFITLLGFTNGYCVAVAMTIGIKSVSPLVQETAGILLSSFLGLGLMFGAFTSTLCIKIL